MHQPCRVLLVEDNDDARAATAELLRLEGLEVTEAGDGEEMFVALAEFKPDIVIMDLGLPGRDGYALRRNCAVSQSTRVCLPSLLPYTGKAVIAKLLRPRF